ncbi:unnamed protein product, partial [Symbiodinium necroappetens]
SCYAKGAPMDPCVCTDGLVVQARSYSEFTFFGAFVFECCGGDAPLRDCEFPERHRRHGEVFRTLAILFLVCGILGTMLTTCSLNARRRYLPLTRGDAELLVPKLQGDGRALHQAVALERWCVSLQDLQQFRRLVMHAVSGGVIQPNERDMFDVRDFHVGPSVYTVNEHFIKPVTAAAGKMSIYEFIDRVESSWPSGARGAYVCFLSNPQNLDIGSLIARPSESPFALALRSSSMVLVLPNSKVSIHTRLWCVYEAFLAYWWGKTIKTAKLNLGFWRCLSRMACLYFASTGAAWLLLMEGVLPLRGLLTLAAIFGSMGCILYLCVGRQLLRLIVCFPVVQVCNAVLCISVSWIFSSLLFLDEEGTLGSTCGLLMLFFWGLVLSCTAETDWLLFRDAEINSGHLRKDFSGRILDAGCSSSSDKENIHHEVLQSGKMHEVEEAVRVLLQMNVVTNELQRTAALVGKLGAGLWLLGFMISPAGRKKFAAVSLQLWLPALLMLMTLPLFGLSADQTIFWCNILGGLLLGPSLLVILFAGPYRVAHVPFLGPALVRFFLGSQSCRCQGRASPSPDSQEGATGGLILRPGPGAEGRISALAAHHATAPQHKRKLLSQLGMGRGRRQPQPQQQWDARDGGHGYHDGYKLWRGAKSPSAPAARPKAPWKADARAVTLDIPSYSSMTLPRTSNAAQAGAVVEITDGDEQLVPSVQTALNGARKAEQRVARLKQAHAESIEKYKLWEMKMKESFRRERGRALKDQERILRELSEAEALQNAARATLRAVAYNMEHGIPQDVAMEDVPSADAVFDSWAAEERTDSMAVLRRALASEITPVRPTMVAPRTPTMPSSMPAMSATPPAVIDPYQAVRTPAASAPPGLMPPGVPLQAPVDPGQPPGPVGLTSEPLPAHDSAVPTGYGPSPPLHDRLARRRALEPFGRARADAGEENPGTATLAEAQAALAAGRRIRILEDDSDELDTAATDGNAGVVAMAVFGVLTVGCRISRMSLSLTGFWTHLQGTASANALLDSGFGPHTISELSSIGAAGFVFYFPDRGLESAFSRQALQYLVVAAECPAPPKVLPFSHRDFSGSIGVVLARGLREAPVQIGDWLTSRSPCDGRSELSHVCLLLSATSYHFCRGQRETSVALGSPPANDVSSLMWDLVVTCVVQGGSIAAAFLVTIAAIHLLVLWRLLLNVPIALVLPWGYATSPQHSRKPMLRQPLFPRTQVLTRLITSEIFLTLPATLEQFVDRVYEAAPSPLDDCLATVLFDARSMTGQEVHLEEGDTLCLAPTRHLPLWGPSLMRSLQQPTPWLSMDPVPATARALCVLILHESGKYLFSDLVQCDWQNCLRVTHFVGVEMSESRLVSAFDLTSYVYHGTPVRGIIAVLRRSTERDQQNRPLPAVLFVDSRPVGQDVNFCVLDHYHVSREFLQRYVKCPTPPGHRLAVMGGQLRGNGFDFHSGEVLTLAFLPVEQGAPEAGESEPDGSDDPFDPSDDGYGSDESTRSRSRRRDVSLSKASGDSSYQSHLPAPADTNESNRKPSQDSCGILASTMPLPFEVCVFDGSGAIHLTLHFGCKLTAANLAFTCPLALKREAPPRLVAKIGDTPPLHTSLRNLGGGEGLPRLPDMRDLGDHSPAREQPPDLFVEAPEFLENPVPVPRLRGLFVVLCEDYRPEVIPLNFWLPVAQFQVLREVQAMRLPDVRQYFPRLLDVRPQPCASFAVLLGITGIPGPFCDVVFDCRAVGGFVFAGHADAEANRAELLAIAGFAHRLDADVWVPSSRGPLQDRQPARLDFGDLVSIAPRGILPPRFAPLAEMLRRPEDWNTRAEIPFASDPGLWLLTDEGPCYHPLPAGAGRIPRDVLAESLGYDRERLVAVPPYPQLRGLCIRGVAASAVLVATQCLPHSTDAEPRASVIIVDLRPLQLGVTWRLAYRGIFSLQRFAEDLDYPCPEGFQLTAEGAPLIPSRPGVVLRVVEGSRITVACVPIPPGVLEETRHREAQSGGTGSDGSSPRTQETDIDMSSAGSSSARSAGPPTPESLGQRPEHSHRNASFVLLNVAHVLCPHSLLLLALSAAPVAASAPPDIGGRIPYEPSDLYGIGLLSFGLWQAFVASQPFAALKLLCEPCCAGPTVQSALSALRTATRNLGLAWPLIPANLANFLDPETEAPAQEAGAQLTRISFAVLTPDYPPETGEVELDLPCTPEEVIQAVQASRPTPCHLRFPFLIPASPQSVVGHAVLLATPRWAPLALTVLVNTSAIDGRIFACYALEYADYSTLIAMADLPPQTAYDVYAGDDDQPLNEGVQIHLFPGMQIAITFADQHIAFGLPFARTLMLPDAWSHALPFPQLDLDQASCVVHEGRHVLCLEDHRSSISFGAKLARRFGIDDRLIHTLAASPAPPNIALEGVKCQALIAVCEKPRSGNAGAISGFFLDQRPIQEGFAFMHLRDPVPDVPSLLRIFQADAPRGWVPRFSNEHEPDGHPTFTSGSVVVVDYVPEPEPSDAPDGDPEANDTATQGNTSAPLSTEHPAANADGSSHPGGGDDPPRGQDGGDDDHPHPDSGADTRPTLPGVFLILSQDYATELVEARIPLDTQAAVALLYVSQARARHDRDRFPILCAVEPQPLGAQAVLLALPQWAPDGVIAAFDLTTIDGRIFALNIGRRATRAALFQAAELPDHPRFEVFVGTMPWPIPADTAVDVRHGDLIQFTFVGRGHSIVASFPDMLRSAHGWHADPTFIRAYSGWNLDDTWVVNEDRPFLLHVSSARRRYVRQDLALRMRIPADELILRPPQLRISDFSNRGWVTCSVLYAARTLHGHHYTAARDPFCFVDLRPILRGISVMTGHGGYLEVSGLFARVWARCPQGFRPIVWRGNHVLATPGSALPVQDGDVFTAAFVPESPPRSSVLDPPDDGPDQPGDDQSGSPYPGGSNPGADRHASEAPSNQDAGTGSSCSSSPADVPASYQIALRPYAGEAFLFGLFSLLLCALAIPLQSRALRVVLLFATLQLRVVDGVMSAACVLPKGEFALSPGSFLPAHEEAPTAATHALGGPLPTPARALSFARVKGPHVPPASGPPKANPTLFGVSSAAGRPPTYELERESLQLGNLSTLLEDSRNASDDYPMYLAATLLDAVLEHHYGDHGYPPTSAKLSLVEALPADCSAVPPVHPAPWPTHAASFDPSWRHTSLRLGGADLGFTASQAALFLQPQVCFGDFRDLLKRLPPDTAKSLCSTFPAAISDSPLLCYVDGSFTPATSSSNALIGWSCVFLDLEKRSISIVSGSGPGWYVRSEIPASAFVAECIAMTAAVWVGSTAFFCRQVQYLSDCQAAIQVASGKAASFANDAALVLRRTASCAEAFLGAPLSIRYVPGHKGLFGNEAADAAAKLASKGNAIGSLVWTDETGDSFDWWVCQAHRVEWCGIAMRSLFGDRTLPPVQSAPAQTCAPCASAVLSEHSARLHCVRTAHPPRTQCGLTPEQVMAPFRPTLPTEGATGERFGKLHLCFATYNVLSLCGKAFADQQPGGLAFAAGRPAMLARCLSEAGVHALAVQEARTETGFLRTADFLRFSSGHESGCLGVELWFLEGHAILPASSQGDAKAAFSKEAFNVIHRDPRRLILNFSSGPLRLCFASLHAPHRGTEASQLHSWWSRTLVMIKEAAARSPVILGGDFNASVGSVSSSRIGDCGPEEQDEAGAFLHELVDACHAWIPATWDQCHTGQCWTYIQKRNQALTRPDLICLPDCWRDAQVSSWVDPSIHVGQPYIDHLASAIQVRAWLKVNKGGSRPKPARIDAKALTDPANQPKLEAILSAAPKIPWNVSADAHAALLVGYLQQELVGTFAVARGHPRQAYITADTWELHGQVAALRKRCARLRRQCGTHLLAAAFRAWAERNAVILHDALSSPWASNAASWGQAQSRQLRDLSQRLRKACRQDRARYLSELADEVQSNKPGSHQALNRLLGLKQKKPFAPDVLPEILDQDGHPCPTPEAALQRWRSYFGDMESGVEMSPADVFAEAGKRHHLAWPTPPDALSLPGPSDVCRAMASIKSHKACGPDGAPGELFKTAPAFLAPLVMPLVFKLGLLGEEAAGLKSALLTWLYKQRGAKNTCSSYRAIMLLPTLTKVIHRAYRPRIYEHVLHHAPPLLLGGRRGASAVFGSHVIRLFCRWTAACQKPACVLFADVASAYYNSIRDLTARRIDDQRQPVSTHVHPDGTEQHEGLASALRGPSAFEASGAMAWLESLAAEFHRGSWFSLRGDHVPVVTRRGSRPGSSLADLMYSSGVAQIVATRDALRAQSPDAGQVPQVPWDSKRDLSPTQTPTTTSSLSDVIWADDMAECFLLSTSQRAAHQVSLEASILDEAFASQGYCLTYGLSKTAARVLLMGDGALLRGPLSDKANSGHIVVGALLLREGARGPASTVANLSFSSVRLCLADPHTLLRVERLRYLRQLSQAAPDTLWALLRQDTSYLKELRDAMQWLFRRVSATVPLQDSLVCWEEWSQIMCEAPGRFRGWIKRAAALEALRLRGFAALQSYRRCLIPFCSNERPEPEHGVRFAEACLPCRKAFIDRVSWACHASRLHGYRTRATEVTKGIDQSWCSGCGKLFANSGRMKRHVFVTPACQVNWGTFHLAGSLPKHPLHPSAPPVQLPGAATRPARDASQDTCHPALLAALLDLDESDDTQVWAVIQDFIAPIEHLRRTVEVWRAHPSAQPFAGEAASNMLLLLDPEVCCDSFQQPKTQPTHLDFLAPLLPPSGFGLPLASSGVLASFAIEAPPLPCFVYPFDCSVPLAAADRHVAWLEASVEVLAACTQTSATSPVRIGAPVTALRCLEPAISWLKVGGLVSTAEGLASP